MACAFLTARWRQGATRVMFLACAAGLIADGWLTALPTEEAPRLWTSLRDSSPDATPVLELPLGPDWDFAAIFHATMHGRRVVNGTSGYDPPHYAPLREGLRLKEPGVLAALALRLWRRSADGAH